MSRHVSRPALLALSFLFLALVTSTVAEEIARNPIPFPTALREAAIEQERLDSIYDRSLILGNGDINGLLYSQGPQLVFRLTKNDVWDARLDTSDDGELLDIEARKKAAAGSGKWPWGIPIHSKQSWLKPYPCPRACANVTLGDGAGAVGAWYTFRRSGHDAWQFSDDDKRALMSVAGKPGSSNGYCFSPLDLSTDEYPTLRVKLSGTENARFFIDILGEGPGEIILSSKWQETPTEPTERTFSLPPECRIHRLILYTWTEDGKPAENRFSRVAFVGKKDPVEIDLSLAGAAGDCSGTLDIHQAVARVHHKEPDSSETVVRALAQRNVFLITSTGKASIGPVPFDPPAETGNTDRGVQWIHQTFPGDPDWPGMSFAVALAQDGERKAIALVSSFEAKDVVASAVGLATQTLADDPKAIIAEHEKAWATFWSASGVDLDDTFLRDVWYRNLYFLRCVSKPGVEAVGLYAGLVSNNPAWHGGHTTNYNAEQTFWTPYISNHVELGEPYERLIHRYLPRGRWFAKKAYGCEGAYYPHNLFAFEPPDPETCKSNNGRMHAWDPWGYTIGISGFVVQNLWWHHQYDPADRDYLERIAYPAVRDVANFYADFIDHCERDDNGRVVLAPSVSPEHWGRTPDRSRSRNGTFGIAFAQFTLDAAIEGANTLDRDAELIERWKAAIRLLPEYPTTDAEEPVVVDVADAPPITYNIAVPAVPVFPAGVITYFSPDEQKRLFIRTLEQVRWNGNNSAVILPVARARLSMPGTTQYMKDQFIARSRPNGTLTLNRLGAGLNNYGHYTEQFAATMAVSELLLQSVENIVRVFPAWPKEQDARFENLRAQGGFLVSAEQSGGHVTKLEIRSTAGGRLRLLCPWETIRIDGVRTVPNPDGIVEIETQRGSTHIFSE